METIKISSYPKLYNTYYNINNIYRKELTFTGLKSEAFTEKRLHSIEYMLRIIGNKIRDFVESEREKTITKTFSLVEPEQSKKYLEKLGEIFNYHSSKKIIGVNLEDKILEKAAQKGKSIIFIMSHSDQTQDPSMLAALNIFLINAYKEAGKGDLFPLPKIILNQDILTTMNPMRRKTFEAFGAIGIDANIHNADKRANARAFLPLIRDFAKDKCNIFIFPEGKLAVQKHLPLNQRFQSGVAEMINKLLGVKKEIDVIPVGFAYGKGKNKKYSGMHIGQPVTFKRIGDKTTVTAGEIENSKYADYAFVRFFNNHNDKTDIVITHNGEPVTVENSKDLTDKIRELLSENLLVCIRRAEKNILDPDNKDTILQI